MGAAPRRSHYFHSIPRLTCDAREESRPMASLPKAEPTAPTGPRFPIRLRPVAMLVSASLIVAATYAFTRLGPMPHPARLARLGPGTQK